MGWNQTTGIFLLRWVPSKLSGGEVWQVESQDFFSSSAELRPKTNTNYCPGSGLNYDYTMQQPENSFTWGCITELLWVGIFCWFRKLNEPGFLHFRSTALNLEHTCRIYNEVVHDELNSVLIHISYSYKKGHTEIM